MTFEDDVKAMKLKLTTTSETIYLLVALVVAFVGFIWFVKDGKKERYFVKRMLLAFALALGAWLAHSIVVMQLVGTKNSDGERVYGDSTGYKVSVLALGILMVAPFAITIQGYRARQQRIMDLKNDRAYDRL